jgi:DNA mismatch repair ATPase MutL
VGTPGDSGNGCSPEVADEMRPGTGVAGDAEAGGADSRVVHPGVNPQGLWIIDQHVAHERILFEKICKQRLAESPERQQLLMPLIVELTPGQMAVFAEISEELNRNGFEVEPFGSRTIAVKTTAAGVAGRTSSICCTKFWSSSSARNSR